MPDRLTITSSNCIMMLTVDLVFPTPVRLQDFGPDRMFDTAQSTLAESQLGVDGFYAAGYLPRVTRQSITLSAASRSFPFFEAWVAAMDEQGEVLYGTMDLRIPAIRKKYNAPQITLMEWPTMPNAGKVLNPREFVIEMAPGVTIAPL